ncbi:MAG: 50S ribosomal protein L15 [Candidatus Azotimanducaceae bacterium WSBS_2022_MAG_OTU7]
MQLNTLKPGVGSRSRSKRVGRGMGSGLGKTCGRGHKGQKSRSGGTVRPGFEGGQQPLQMRLPKFGFNSAKARITAEVTLSEIGSVEADVIDVQALIDADLLKGTMKRAKVILSGKIDKAVTLKGIRATKGARAAIEAAGGSIEESL